jgi:glucokinase
MEQTLEYISSKIEKLITPETDMIGIGVPSVVDINKGIVYETQNIPSWKEVHLKEYLEERFGVRVAVNNDANCYAMGVYGTFPADSKPGDLVVITLGTGVGLGIVHEGKLFCGANCGAGELCSLPYMDSILEDYCSKKYFTAAGWDSIAAAQAAIEKDPEALRLFEEFGKHMGALLTAVMLAYDPSHIVLSGGIAHNYPFFRESMVRHIREGYPYMNSFEKLVIGTCTDDNIPVLGAALI